MKLYIRQKQRYWLITNPEKSKHLRDRRYIVTCYEQPIYRIEASDHESRSTIDIFHVGLLSPTSRESLEHDEMRCNEK